MAEPRSRVLPTALVTAIVVIIVGWLATLVMATPAPPEQALVDRLTQDAARSVSVSFTLTPRIPLDAAPTRWAVGRGTVTAAFVGDAPLPWRDKGGTLAFAIGSAKITDVQAEVLYLEDEAGARIPLPEDTSELRSQVEVALRTDALVGGLLRQADAQLLRQLRARFGPMGYYVEALPGEAG